MVRTRTILLAPLMAVFFAGSALAGFALCPDATGLTGPAPLGAGESCGDTVTVTPSMVDINVGETSIIATESELTAWLGLPSDELIQDGIFPFGGSAALFPSVLANPGDLLHFSWSGAFEPEATGFLFYALNGVVNVLDSQVFFGNMTMYSAVDMLSMPSSMAVPLHAGNNTVAFGVVVGTGLRIKECPPDVLCKVICENELDCFPEDFAFADPSVTVSSISVGPSAVPEPGTIALMGMGLLGLAALRRKRS